jgi:hypothetical protein
MKSVSRILAVFVVLSLGAGLLAGAAGRRPGSRNRRAGCRAP